LFIFDDQTRIHAYWVPSPSTFTDTQKVDIHLRDHALPSLLLPISSLNVLKPEGAVGYLEDLMACLDAPLLGDVDIINTYSPFDAEEIDWLIQFQ
jgi:hypothetical protein